MSIGQKIIMLKDSCGFKNFQDFGRAIGYEEKEPGRWLSDMSKKESLQTVDITKIQKLCDYCNVSLDWFLNNKEDKEFIIKDNLKDFDIGVMLDNIQLQLKTDDNYFYGYILNKESNRLINDSIDLIKNLVKNNL